MKWGLEVGSIGYIAPEILLHKPYGEKIDVFSAGASLCYAVPNPQPLVLRVARGRTLFVSLQAVQLRDTRMSG